jgi:hypothetical protein
MGSGLVREMVLCNVGIRDSFEIKPHCSVFIMYHETDVLGATFCSIFTCDRRAGPGVCSMLLSFVGTYLDRGIVETRINVYGSAKCHARLGEMEGGAMYFEGVFSRGFSRPGTTSQIPNQRKTSDIPTNTPSFPRYPPISTPPPTP